VVKIIKTLDRKLIWLLSLFYGVFIFVSLLRALYFRYFIFTSPPKKSLWELIIFTYFIDLVVVVGFMILITTFTKHLFSKNIKWHKIILFHIAFSLLIGLFTRVFGSAFRILIGSERLSEFSIEKSFTDFMGLLHMNFLVYFAMTFIIYTYYYLDRMKKTEYQKNSLETKLVKTRMKMLKSQMQPHFLFNTLNTISSLTQIDAKKAQDIIADLSDFLRDILYDNKSSLISLEMELSTLHHYLNIIKTRFADHLSVHIDVDPALLDKKVPSLLLQPIIENSIKYGYSKDVSHLTITMKITSWKHTLIIKIFNDGEPLENASSNYLKNGIGLSNLLERLTTLYAEDFSFKMSNISENKGVVTTIIIPTDEK
jgi:two-component system LytT family sensor kinase